MADSTEGSEAGDQFISISNALKLISQPFDGNKNKLKEFLDNADTAFELVNPVQHSILLKFVKSKVIGDAKSKLLVRERTNSWEEVKEILEENYSVRRTIDYYACKLFNARQGNSESVANWGSRVDTLVTDLKEAAMRVCTAPQEQGALALIHHLARACFTQGLNSERIQTILRSKSTQIETLGMAVETALEEESNLLSQKERGRTTFMKVSPSSETRPVGTHYGNNSHRSDNCFLRKPFQKGPVTGKKVYVGMSQENERYGSYSNRENRGTEGTPRVYHAQYTGNQKDVTCFSCGGKGHLSRYCPQNKSEFRQPRGYEKHKRWPNAWGQQKETGNYGNYRNNGYRRGKGDVSIRDEKKGNERGS